MKSHCSPYSGCKIAEAFFLLRWLIRKQLAERPCRLHCIDNVAKGEKKKKKQKKQLLVSGGAGPADCVHIYADVCDRSERPQLLQRSLCLRFFTCFRIKEHGECNEGNEG